MKITLGIFGVIMALAAYYFFIDNAANLSAAAAVISFVSLWAGAMLKEEKE